MLQGLGVGPSTVCVVISRTLHEADDSVQLLAMMHCHLDAMFYTAAE